MSEPMTLEEAVRVAEWARGLTVHSDAAQIMPDAMSHQKASDVLERVLPALAAFAAHAERTVAARSGEPEAVQYVRSGPLFYTERACIAHIDTLTAELAAARRERDEWVAKLRDAANNMYVELQEVAELTAERDAARQEFAEWLDASQKALDTHAEVVAERDRLAAIVERVREIKPHQSAVVAEVRDGTVWPTRLVAKVYYADILAALGEP